MFGSYKGRPKMRARGEKIGEKRQIFAPNLKVGLSTSALHGQFPVAHSVIWLGQVIRNHCVLCLCLFSSEAVIRHQSNWPINRI
jgi:hypothetical protein